MDAATESAARETATAPRAQPNVRRATAWVVAGYAGAQILRLGGNLVLWRLLEPKAFGLLALVNVFIQGLHMFSDVGIGPSIIQNPRGEDPDYLNTAWTIQVGRGVLLCIVAALAAMPLAHFYEVPQLLQLVPVVALSTVIQGFNSTRLFSARRNVSLGRVTAYELASQTAGLVAMIALAWVTRSVWSLVAGGLVSSAVMMALSHLALPGIRNGFCWHRPSVHALVHFGRWIFLSTVLTFAVLHSDRLIFGKLITLEQLGVYSVATVWAGLPRTIMGQLSSSIVFPLLSRAHNDKDDFLRAFGKVRLPWLLVAGWMATCLVAGGPTLITFFYDERAKDAQWIVQLLAIGAWISAVDAINQTAVMAQGRPKWMVVSNVAKLVGMVTLIPIGYSLYGFAGAVGGLACTEVFSYLATLVALGRSRVFPFGVDIAVTAGIVATAFLGRFSIASAQRVFGSLSNQPRLVAFVDGVVALLVLSAVWFLAWRAVRTLGWASLSRPSRAEP
jgi:O-antigen/teichoic acid export membrane protein